MPNTPRLTGVKTWRETLEHSRLRTFTGEHNRFWIEANAPKDSRQAKLARQGHGIAWEFDSLGASYPGCVLIDGKVYTSREATKKFLQGK